VPPGHGAAGPLGGWDAEAAHGALSFLSLVFFGGGRGLQMAAVVQCGTFRRRFGCSQRGAGTGSLCGGRCTPPWFELALLYGLVGSWPGRSWFMAWPCEGGVAEEMPRV
jgi:hypothetical protein